MDWKHTLDGLGDVVGGVVDLVHFVLFLLAAFASVLTRMEDGAEEAKASTRT